ncbi:AAA family ATPase [Burkholderia sp. WAC0059]|uniref:AAA family ATPase n=1 Tax=Burkholderia sp. WAC0059 TaxID=2066022 RepID=UPI000C7EABB6|nr:AAA family ATPase [Burkholderia sp. WAC0059]PLZ00869.1 AAA family ATPase [Burkholderia sp. WAC0059]
MSSPVPLHAPAHDSTLVGFYDHPDEADGGHWVVSRSDRPHMYRIQHRRADGETDVDTVVDPDNLEAKLHKWRREGFVRRAEAGQPAAEPAGREHFMRDLRQAAASASNHDDETREDGKDYARIGGVAVPTGSGGPLVPAVNAAYLFSAQAENVARDVAGNRRLLLIGHTGTGKTSLIEQIAARANQGVLRSNMNGQTTVGDFVGFWTVKGGETIWIDGVLPAAMRAGLWLIVDEVDFAEPAILAVLTAVLEPGGRLLLKEKGNETVAPHPAFRLFATANAVGMMGRYRHLYQGANLMNDAFLDRWRVYHVDYLSPADEAQVLRQTFGERVTAAMADTLAAIAAACREAFLREDLAGAFSTRRLLDWTELMLHTGDPETAAGPTIYAKVGAEDAELIRGIVRHYIALDG